MGIFNRFESILLLIFRTLRPILTHSGRFHVLEFLLFSLSLKLSLQGPFCLLVKLACITLFHFISSSQALSTLFILLVFWGLAGLGESLSLLNFSLMHLCGLQRAFSLDFMDLLLSEAEINIFRLEICMDDLAHSVQKIQANQALLCHLSNDWQRSSFIVVSFNYF